MKKATETRSSVFSSNIKRSRRNDTRNDDEMKQFFSSVIDLICISQDNEVDKLLTRAHIDGVVHISIIPLKQFISTRYEKRELKFFRGSHFAFILLFFLCSLAASFSLCI